MKVKDIMTKEVEIVHPDDSLKEAARKMRVRDIGFLPVCDGDHLVGVVTDRDIALRFTAEGTDQYTIYDTKPGDPGYSPLWRHNYVIVPRDYQPQSLRSKEDILQSGFRIVPTDKITN